MNIDAGRLQNPVYYSDAHRTAFLHAFPAWLPSQVALAGAFSTFDVGSAVVRALAYALVLLLVAGVGYRLRHGIAR